MPELPLRQILKISQRKCYKLFEIRTVREKLQEEINDDAPSSDIEKVEVLGRRLSTCTFVPFEIKTKRKVTHKQVVLRSTNDDANYCVYRSFRGSSRISSSDRLSGAHERARPSLTLSRHYQSDINMHSNTVRFNTWQHAVHYLVASLVPYCL